MATQLPQNHFSVRWKKFSSVLTSGLLSHLTEEDFVDVTLAVEGQLLQAHKLILSICSPYFKDIFKENPCQHPVIILKDMKHTEIEALLQFMYQGEVHLSEEDLPLFLKAAQTLQIRGLSGVDTKNELLSCNAYCETELNSSTSNVNNELNLNALNVSPKTKEILEGSSKCHDSSKKEPSRKRETGSPELHIPEVALKKKPKCDKYEEILVLENDDSNDSISVKKEPEDDTSIIENDVTSEKDGKIELTEPPSIKENCTLIGNMRRILKKKLYLSTKATDNLDTKNHQFIDAQDTIQVTGRKLKRGSNVKRKKRARCYLCVGKDNKYSTKCTVCSKYVCTRHATHTIVCAKCNVEPVTYRLSARGRPQLVHEGYVYNLTSRSEVLNRSHYRCAEQHRGCRGKCAVIAERFMPTGVHEHNHPPGYQSEHDYRKKGKICVDADST